MNNKLPFMKTQFGELICQECLQKENNKKQSVDLEIFIEVLNSTNYKISGTDQLWKWNICDKLIDSWIFWNVTHVLVDTRIIKSSKVLIRCLASWMYNVVNKVLED